MFLSKIELTTPTRLELQLDTNVRAAHVLVTKGLDPSEPRFLYRDDGRFIIVQTHKKPRWQIPSEVKEFSLEFERGQVFRFRSRLNVCKAKANPDKNKNSTLVGIGSENLQVEWLRDKATRNQGTEDGKEGGGGFIVHDVAALDEHMRYCPDTEPRPRPDLVFRSVLFEGILEITNPASFECAFKFGFGRGKSFGFGLISLASR